MSRYEPPPTNQFRGRSLSFVRTVLNKSEPLASSAFAFAERYKAQLVRDPSLVRVGMVIFWGDREPGDCGLYVGDGRVLCLDSFGNPSVRPINSVVVGSITGAMFWPSLLPKSTGVRNGN
jgi:hypothetical protein